MFPKHHFILGLIFSCIALFLFPQIGIIGFLIIWFSSFLIDVDHYLFFVFAKHKISLKKAHTWFVKKELIYRTLSKSQRKKIPQIPCILHGIEAIVILIVLSFVHKFFLYVLIGFLFHEFLDFIHAIRFKYPFDHFGSQTYNILRFNYPKKFKKISFSDNLPLKELFQ